jgi:uncharacterized protein Usg
MWLLTFCSVFVVFGSTPDVSSTINAMPVEKVLIYTSGILGSAENTESLVLAKVGLARLLRDAENIGPVDVKVILAMIQSLGLNPFVIGMRQNITTKDKQVLRDIYEIYGKFQTTKLVGHSSRNTEAGKIIHGFLTKQPFPSATCKSHNEMLQVFVNSSYPEVPNFPEQSKKIRKWLKEVQAYYRNLMYKIRPSSDPRELEKILIDRIPQLKDSVNLQIYIFIKFYSRKYEAAAVALLLYVRNSGFVKDRLFRAYCAIVAGKIVRFIDSGSRLYEQLKDEILLKFFDLSFNFNIGNLVELRKESKFDSFVAAIWFYETHHRIDQDDLQILKAELAKPEYVDFTDGVNEFREFLNSQ